MGSLKRIGARGFAIILLVLGGVEPTLTAIQGLTGGRWTGISVAAAQTQLEDGAAVSGRIRPGEWIHYFIDIPDWIASVTAELKTDRVGNLGEETAPALYARLGALPTLEEWDFRAEKVRSGYQLQINETSAPLIQSGRYYLSVYGRSRSPFVLKATRRMSVSRFAGMGANLYDHGVAFRVWAPFADSVNLAGQFNQWNSLATPLQSEGNGYWSVDYRNAQAGQQYLYVIRRAGQTLWRTDPREEQVTNSAGNTVIYDPQFEWTDQSFQMAPWNEWVVYQMHVGTFHDSAGGRPGNFDSAIDRLEYLQQLGVNAVNLMPVQEFAGDYSWGYNPSHPFAIEEAYGGPDGLKRFVNAAHARGIAVLGDVVHNHWGPSDLGTWQFDGWHQDNRGGIYFYQDDRANTPWGDTRPDYGRGEVRQFIRDNALMLLNDFHLDGLRWDSTLNIRSHAGGDLPDGWSLMQWVNNDINQFQPWTISIAEDLQNNDWLTRETGAGGAGFDSQWCSRFVHPVREVIVPADDQQRDMFKVRDAVENRFNGDAFQRVIYTESHDEVANGRSRVAEEIWPGNAGSWFSRKRSTLGAALVMTSPGVPMIFQGQEILEDGYFRDDDPVDWSKAQTYAGIRKMYEDLIKLRRNWFNQTRGLRGQHLHFFHLNQGAKLVAFHRWDQGGPGDDVLVVLNFRDQTQENYRMGLPRGGLWRVRFNSDWNGYSGDFGNLFSPDISAENTGWDGMPFSGTLRIAPYSVLILSQDSQ